MRKGISRHDPRRADHRIIAYLLDSVFPKKRILHVPDEFDRIADVFKKAGGSWEALFRGSASEIDSLRRILKVAIKEGRLSRKPNFR